MIMTNKNITNIIILYGIILGLVLSFQPIYSYFIDNKMFANPLLGWSLLLAVPVFGLLSIIRVKKIQNSYISFKESLRSYTITITVGLFISTLAFIYIFNFADANFHKIVRKVQIEYMESKKDMYLNKMKENNVSEETIETMKKSFYDELEKMPKTNQYTIKLQFVNFVKSVGAWLIFGLILSAILKKSKPQRV